MSEHVKRYSRTAWFVALVVYPAVGLVAGYLLSRWV